ncbi:ferrochelatase [Streptomyces zhaozhouensis]|uniref:Coproporphyrin III ferrochelatase n=1 Tax=Streptomyces zhaozhouensis TaxID=1300267 RepID=A0A286DZX0_9ACTN|nr:ferrochelatase [Streptomyces zhaozhouensis]SOD64215.1 ferrochelatase [Streptomyces zhaozhouensis]
MEGVHAAQPYDALLLLSFGGPEGPDDVLPFLENVTRGRGIPRERLAEVGAHYHLFGGVSPINEQNRTLLAALGDELAAHDIDLPVYWGNRNWAPYLTDTLRQMVADGRRRVLALVTSAYASYSGCRQYREDLAEALLTLREEGLEVPRVDKLRLYYNHPGFLETVAEGVRESLERLPSDARAGARLVFSTHSIPDSAADVSGPPPGHGPGGAYVAQHMEAARVVAERVAEATGVERAWELVYQSRSGSPRIPWLEPDVNDRLRELAAEGVGAVVLVPVGFVSDHMEVRYDLDTEALATAEELGLLAVRAPTVGAHPRFVAALRELVVERAAAERGQRPERPALGAFGASHDLCPVGCCAGRVDKPAAAGADSPFV